MAGELLKKVGESEERADQIRKQAHEAAKGKLDQARERAKAIVTDSETKIKELTAQKLQQAAQQSEEQAQVYLRDIAKQGEQIQAEARKNLGKAADIIVAKVVSVSG